jgi:hypothetical protein
MEAKTTHLIDVPLDIIIRYCIKKRINFSVKHTACRVCDQKGERNDIGMIPFLSFTNNRTLHRKTITREINTDSEYKITLDMKIPLHKEFNEKVRKFYYLGSK